MLSSSEIRSRFLDFFREKGHTLVPSAPIVVKNDPTLMFTNAGMNQFKDVFLGNEQPVATRVADTQKCLRVSGKHNDLEEVGVDTYHHTMFEMLGNWSFGDYFKAEAIAWSWELLTAVYGLDKNRLYVTIFEGDEKEGLPRDTEAFEEWKKWVPEDRILLGNKKDNLWEMGDTGPCGPCTEIHYDGRPDAERAAVPGQNLVNRDNPQVIEIWNNVFIQFCRMKDGRLESLPARHVDTGMGFERLVRVIQGKTSNYDTDVFTPTIKATEQLTGKTYDYGDSRQAVAFRVLADHLRAISFTIADGQLPSSNGAGYVIRRILRRAVRYYFSFLDYKQPLLYRLVPALAEQFAAVFPELKAQQDFVGKVILEEENGFLRTLENGLKRMEDLQVNKGVVPGEVAFELTDTFGFPLDLTQLIAAEKGWTVDTEGFQRELQKQKDRSRAAAAVDTEDWVVLDASARSRFTGYTQTTGQTRVVKYRKVSAKGKTQYQVVLEETPFYAESGGQVGDTGTLQIGTETLTVTDTKKENDLIVHFTDRLAEDMQADVQAAIDASRRRKIARHHSVTHLMHAALREVLGTHVAQKGSLVSDEYLRFDFSHFAKVSEEELAQIEKLVNRKIRQNIPVVIREMAKEEALKLGAMALFGEKYGDTVRVVIMDESYSIELCGGTHVMRTGDLGLFKITSEGAVAAGVRRIEALAGCKAEAWVNAQVAQLHAVKQELRNPKDLLNSVRNLQEERNALQKQIEKMEGKLLAGLCDELLTKKENINGVEFLGALVEVSHADALRKLCFDMKPQLGTSYLVCLCANIGGKPAVAVMVDDQSSFEAPKLIKEHVATLIKGGGGGQKTLATAGGQEAGQLDRVPQILRALL